MLRKHRTIESTIRPIRAIPSYTRIVPTNYYDSNQLQPSIYAKVKYTHAMETKEQNKALLCTRHKRRVHRTLTLAEENDNTTRK